MKRLTPFLFALLFVAEAVAVADQRGDETLKFFLSKSHVVVVGKITSTLSEDYGAKGVPIFVGDFKIDDVLKGDVGLKGKTIMVNIVRIEMDKKDHHPLIKKNAKCILFLKERKAKRGPWETADVWFGVQHPSPYMAKSLKRLAKQEVVEQTEPADTGREIRTVRDVPSSPLRDAFTRSLIGSSTAIVRERYGHADMHANAEPPHNVVGHFYRVDEKGPLRQWLVIWCRVREDKILDAYWSDGKRGRAYSDAPPQSARPSATQVVRTAFEKIQTKQGKYFDHVWRILETPGSVQALIVELDSTNADDARQAWIILSRISQTLERHTPDEEPRDKAYWEKWWTEAGRTMPIEIMKINFDSHWQ